MYKTNKPRTRDLASLSLIFILSSNEATLSSEERFVATLLGGA